MLNNQFASWAILKRLEIQNSNPVNGWDLYGEAKQLFYLHNV
jgi:hypothetical protein